MTRLSRIPFNAGDSVSVIEPKSRFHLPKQLSKLVGLQLVVRRVRAMCLTDRMICLADVEHEQTGKIARGFAASFFVRVNQDRI